MSVLLLLLGLCLLPSRADEPLFYSRQTFAYVDDGDSPEDARFLAARYFNDRQAERYDSSTGKAYGWALAPGGGLMHIPLPRPSDSDVRNEKGLRARMAWLRETYPGLRYRSVQTQDGCVVWKGGAVTGFKRYAVDGEPYASYDTTTNRWTPNAAGANVWTSSENSNPETLAEMRESLEQVCAVVDAEMLHFMNRDLLPAQSPEVSVRRTGRTARCRADGFYPATGLEVRWVTDAGEEWTRDSVAMNEPVPNFDGTYQYAVQTKLGRGVPPLTCRVRHAASGTEREVPAQPPARRCGMLALVCRPVHALLWLARRVIDFFRGDDGPRDDL